MKNILTKNAPASGDLVTEYIDTAYDNVKLVADNLTMLAALAASLEDGTWEDLVKFADIDTLAELNAIVTDATIISAANIDTLAKLDAYLTDGNLIASRAYVDNAVVGLFENKGGYNAATNTPNLDVAPSGIKNGDTYQVTVGGTFYAVVLEAGDVLTANQDNPTASAHWTIVNKNIDSSAFATAAEGELASTALQPGNNISEMVNDAGYTDDMTGAEIKAAYEAEADTNAFTDAEKTKLGLIEASATADQTGSEIESLYNAQVAAASQLEAEAGTEVAIRRWSPLRVGQAIAALGGGGGGGGMAFSYATINTTLAADEGLYSEDGLTHTLPATPTLNDKCSVWDVSDNAKNNAITILRNGETIMGVAGDFSLNMNGGRVDFLYNGTTWLYSYVVQTIQPSTTITRIESMRIYPADITPASLSSKTVMGSASQIPVILLPENGVEYCQAHFNIKFPATWNGGAIRSRIVWAPTTANTGLCTVLFLGIFYGDGVNATVPAGSTIGDMSDTPLGTANNTQVSPWGAWTVPDGAGNYEKTLYGRLQRQGPTDAFTGGAQIQYLEIEYTTTETLTAAVTNNPSAVTRIVSGTTDTLLDSDNGKEIIYTSGSAIAVTLPSTFAEGWNCVITQAGAGKPTVTRSGAETINGAATGVSPYAQWKGMYLSKYAAGAWIAKY